jgi:hypothetical protein
MFKISSEIKSEKASCGVFAFFGFIHTLGKTHYYVFSVSLNNNGRCPAPVKSFH